MSATIFEVDVHDESIDNVVTERKTQTTRFPGVFASGQHAVSQAQMIDHARTSGWQVRPGDNASMIASGDGREVVLPASGITYSVEESARLVAELIPSPYEPPARGRPGSPQFAEVLAAYCGTGLPTVGVGGAGLRSCHGSASRATTRCRCRPSTRIWRPWPKQRWPWAQPWHPRTVRIENREWVRQRSEVWKPRTKNGKTATKWQPARHAAICMWASSARHVSGQDDEYISKPIEAKDLRTLRRAAEIGSRTWASLGGWPWTMREGGRLTAEWWQLDDIWEALATEIELRVRRAERLIAALQP